MQVTLWPFWSQQNKWTREFLPTCGNVKQLVFLASALRERGHSCVGVAPYGVASPFDCTAIGVHLPLQNPLQRVHWDTAALERACSHSDVLVTNSEYLSIPARALFPNMKIVQMCNVQPDSTLFYEAFRCADLVVAQGEYPAQQLAERGVRRVTWWSLAYDERDFVRPSVERDIDVCFVQRCSADNSTRHEDFIAQMKWRTVFTDVTYYLRAQRPALEYCTAETYIDTLFRSKVAVSMHASWYGGLSIREAIRAGCTPVCLDAPAYRALLGDSWPHYCTPATIAETVDRALAEPRAATVDESYQSGVGKAVEHVAGLLGRS